MPIVKASSDKRDELREVKEPDAVSVPSASELPTTKAKTLQDGFNAFTKRHEMGTMFIKASNGEIGFIAAGSGVYDMEMSSITAVRNSQRLAYLQGLMYAKVQHSQRRSFQLDGKFSRCRCPEKVMLRMTCSTVSMTRNMKVRFSLQ